MTLDTSSCRNWFPSEGLKNSLNKTIHYIKKAARSNKHTHTNKTVSWSELCDLISHQVVSPESTTGSRHSLLPATLTPVRPVSVPRHTAVMPSTHTHTHTSHPLGFIYLFPCVSGSAGWLMSCSIRSSVVLPVAGTQWPRAPGQGRGAEVGSCGAVVVFFSSVLCCCL